MAEKSRAEVFDFGPFRLDAAQGILLRDGERAALVPKAVELLTLLVQRGGSVVGKQELLDALWPDVVVEEGNLAKLVHLLRRELGADGIIETVPKRGYLFKGNAAAPAADAIASRSCRSRT